MVGLKAGIGFILLAAGSQLYWLFAGAMTFLVSIFITPEFSQTTSQRDLIIYSTTAAFVSILLAVALKKWVVALAGFFAGGFLSFTLPKVIGWTTFQFSWWIFIAVGLVCAFLIVFSYGLAVMLLSSLVGAALVAENLHISVATPSVVFILFFFLGFAIQLVLSQYSNPEIGKK